MDFERWQRIKTVYQEALDRPDGERESFVRELSAGDTALADEVLQLLAVATRDADAVGTIVDAASVHFGEAIAGTRIGAWRLVGVLGRGGMGEVYLAERADEEFTQRVAIKMVGGFGITPGLVERFRLERQILANLEHPNIARLLDGGTTAGGVPYLVMEFVDGEALIDFVERRDFSLRACLLLFLKICDAVQYAHRKLVIHRDIKPSNVLVGQDGEPKLLDFGIAKLLDADAGEALTQVESRIMTPEYASPEQLSGAPVTTSTDVYGLGLLLYQLLTGALPYDLASRTSPEIREIICNTEPVAPSRAAANRGHIERGAKLRGDLDNIVMMALRKDPQRRYATVRELAADIEHFLANRPVVARGDVWSYRAGKFIRRNASALAVAAVVLGAIAAQTVFYTQELTRERDHALEERRVAESTTDFLVGLFDVNDPKNTRGDTITAREILDVGAAKLRDELRDDADVRARLLQTVGRVYERLGLYDEAEPLMHEAVELNRELFDGGSVRLVDSLNELAWLHYRREAWPQAKALAEETLALQRAATGGIDTAAMVRTLNMLGTVTYFQDDHEGSLDYYQQALALLDGPEHESSAVRGGTLNHLGIVYTDLSRYDDAERVYLESLSIRQRTLGAEHPDTATALVNLGAFYASIRRFDDAEDYATRGLAIDRQTKGDVHADVAFDLGLLAHIERSRGNPAAALPYVAEASEIWLETVGSSHSRYARSLDGLAETYRMLGRLDDAARESRRSLELLVSHYGPQHSLASDAHHTLGKILIDQGALQDARRHLDTALAIRLDAYGENYIGSWDIMHMLAVLALREGDTSRAAQRIATTRALIERAGMTDIDVYEKLGTLLP